jgi:hypothetical protein
MTEPNVREIAEVSERRKAAVAIFEAFEDAVRGKREFSIADIEALLPAAPTAPVAETECCVASKSVSWTEMTTSRDEVHTWCDRHRFGLNDHSVVRTDESGVATGEPLDAPVAETEEVREAHRLRKMAHADLDTYIDDPEPLTDPVTGEHSQTLWRANNSRQLARNEAQFSRARAAIAAGRSEP